MPKNISYATKKRSAILRFFKDNFDREITAYDIHEFLLTEGMDVNITTVYRYLDKLVNDGTVIKNSHGKNGMASYQFISGDEACKNHLHLKCSNCGKVEHLDCEFMKEIAVHVGLSHGFTIECKESYIYGTCAKCRKNQGEVDLFNLEEEDNEKNGNECCQHHKH